MSLTYPYSLSTFANLLKLGQCTFSPSYGQEYSGQASGIIIAKDLRPALWKVTATTVPLKFSDANDIQALLEGLSGSIQTFYLFNPLRPYPKMAPIVDTTCEINTLGTDGLSLSLKGLASGAVISRGDMISFSYGGRPSQALHRVLETVTVSGGGTTVEFAVSPPPRPGYLTSTPVTLNKPYGEFRMVSPFVPNHDTVITATYSFTAIQVL
jgi:hypothetical protein